jgi:uncharacterized membrane protein YgcG
MNTLALILLMQYVVSTKAGLVNYVQGSANVAAGETVAAGTPIKTGENALVEVLLNPGSFLRMSANSEVILDGVELTDVSLRVVSGAVVIEASEIDKAWPVKVTTGNVAVFIVESGLYKFENGKAAVLSGTIETADSRIPIKKGWSVFTKDNIYRSLKIARNEPATSLERWSEARSEIMVAANQRTYRGFRDHPTVFSSRSSAWIFSPAFGFWTYMPAARARSAYGARYLSYSDLYAGNGGSRNSGGSAGDASSPGQSPRTGFGSGGGSNSGGDGGYSPANDKPTYRESIPMKNAPRPPGPGGI